jgi:hypothetical protein
MEEEIWVASPAQVTHGALLHGAAWHDACIEILLTISDPAFETDAEL